ncbi:hypothetical protein, partial [Teichococcus aestuarii]|uniref:hypothetical protein n=1 Tax=Teichococcus aestuarii TaxID=568898 RepID=UPI0036089950
AGMGWLMLAVGLNLSGVFQLGGPVALGSGVAAAGRVPGPPPRERRAAGRAPWPERHGDRRGSRRAPLPPGAPAPPLAATGS